MKKIIIFTTLFFATFQGIFAFDVELESNKSSVNINDSFELTVKITNLENTSEFHLNVEDIEGLDQFQVLSQNKFTTSYATIVSVNGKQEKKIEKEGGIKLILIAKKEGTFEIGGVEVTSPEGKKESNSVLVEVSGKKLKSFFSDNTKHINLHKEKQSAVFTKTIILQVIVISLLIFSVILMIIFSRNNRGIPSKDDYYLKASEQEGVNTHIEVPAIGDKNFLDTSESYIKRYLQEKYNIDTRLSLRNILNNIQLNPTDKGKLGQFIELFEKIKYGNADNLKIKLLEVLQEFK